MCQQAVLFSYKKWGLRDNLSKCLAFVTSITLQQIYYNMYVKNLKRRYHSKSDIVLTQVILFVELRKYTEKLVLLEVEWIYNWECLFNHDFFMFPLAGENETTSA